MSERRYTGVGEVYWIVERGRFAARPFILIHSWAFAGGVAMAGLR